MSSSTESSTLSNGEVTMYVTRYPGYRPPSDGVPQLDYETLVDTEGAFTTFVNACAQAGAVKCPPVGMIKGNATGSDVHTLITSTIDVSWLSGTYRTIRLTSEP